MVEHGQLLIGSEDLCRDIETLQEHIKEATELGWHMMAGEDKAKLAAVQALLDDVRSRGYKSFTLIRDSHLHEWAQEYAESAGLVQDCSRWPACCIDWDTALDQVKVDLTEIEWYGITYWARS